MANNIRACFIHPEDHQGPVAFGDWYFIKKIPDEIAHERKISGMAGKLELAFFHSNKSRWRVLSPASSLYHKKNACRARARPSEYTVCYSERSRQVWRFQAFDR